MSPNIQVTFTFLQLSHIVLLFLLSPSLALFSPPFFLFTVCMNQLTNQDHVLWLVEVSLKSVLTYRFSLFFLSPGHEGHLCAIITLTKLTAIHIVVWFLPSILCGVSTLIDLRMWNHPCAPGVNPTWSWSIIFLMYCRIRSAGILFRIFASVCIRDHWSVLSLPGFGSRVVVAS